MFEWLNANMQTPLQTQFQYTLFDKTQKGDGVIMYSSYIALLVLDIIFSFLTQPAYEFTVPNACTYAIPNIVRV